MAAKRASKPGRFWGSSLSLLHLFGLSGHGLGCSLFFHLDLREIDVGVAYAIWPGLGTASSQPWA